VIFIFFFFSSRRRHTRWPRDWSSDVCSSDLPVCTIRELRGEGRVQTATGSESRVCTSSRSEPTELAWVSLFRMIVGIRWAMRMRKRVLLQLFHHHLNGLLQLRIAALKSEFRIELRFDIRGDTVIFHFPLAIGIPDAGARR